MNSGIIAFICSKCGFEFSEFGGGRCCVCEKLFCLAHLKVTIDKSTKEKQAYCLDCLNELQSQQKPGTKA